MAYSPSSPSSPRSKRLSVPSSLSSLLPFLSRPRSFQYHTPSPLSEHPPNVSRTPSPTRPSQDPVSVRSSVRSDVTIEEMSELLQTAPVSPVYSHLHLPSPLEPDLPRHPLPPSLDLLSPTSRVEIEQSQYSPVSERTTTRSRQRFSGPVSVRDMRLSEDTERTGRSTVTGSSSEQTHRHAVVSRASLQALVLSPATYTSLPLSRGASLSLPNSGRDDLFQGAFVLGDAEYSDGLASPLASTISRAPSQVGSAPMPTSRRVSMPRSGSGPGSARSPSSTRRYTWAGRRDSELGMRALARRADALGDMLAVGRLPADADALSGRYSRIVPAPHKKQKRVTLAFPPIDRPDRDREYGSSSLDEEKRGVSATPAPRRRWVWLRWIALGVVLLAAILGIILGVLLTRHHNSPTPEPIVLCANNMTGTLCNLDPKCVCTSKDICLPIAQAILSVIPAMNRNFNLSASPSDVALTMFDLKGVQTDNCAAQAVLIDVGTSLDGVALPNHTMWAQSALLYSLHRSEDLASVADMRSFVSSANFTQLQDDQSVPTSSGQYTIAKLGYVFDFAAMAVVVPVTSFQEDAKPSQAQINSLSSTDVVVLNSLYTSARASAAQRSVALSKYWTTELQLPASRLPTFVTAMQTSPVALPFDATSAVSRVSMLDLFRNSSTLQVPPPAACYPRIGKDALRVIEDFEHSLFGLPSINGPNTDWNETCFAERPVYGVLNPFRWRAPFLETKDHPGQALSISQSAKARAVFHLGEMLAGFPFDQPPANFTSDYSDPREFGTFNHMEHVLLAFLQAMPSAKLAAAAAQFIMDAASSPWTSPPSSPLLANVSAQMPVIGVAFFGSLSPSDVGSIYSDFSSPSGSLFFGSDAGVQFRKWALQDVRVPIAWANGSLAAQYVADARPDDAFDAVWQAAQKGDENGLQTVVDMFTQDLYFES